MPEPLVRFRGVSKSFGRAQALRGIDLDLAPGACAGLTGVNGAGKTTLIKCLLDLCALDVGAIAIDGIEHRRPQARARLAYLPERFAAPYFLTGREFMAMMLELFGRSYDDEAVRTVFATLDLDSAALDKPVRDYSKGMTQKLGLAACLLSNRELYVLDEPMSGLDPAARARTKERLLELKAQGRTLLITSHSLSDVEELCDQITVLHMGALAYAGTPDGLCETYEEPTLERAFLKCIESHAR
jgi:ABC-2 type transport system ATP-binding protein